MKKLVSVRLDEVDLGAMDAAARAAGVSQSQFIRDAIRSAIGRRPEKRKPRKEAVDMHAEDLRKLAAAASSYEAQIVARAGLSNEQAAKLKDHRIATIAAWRSWGVQAAFLGLDMRPKGAKHEKHE